METVYKSQYREADFPYPKKREPLLGKGPLDGFKPVDPGTQGELDFTEPKDPTEVDLAIDNMFDRIKDYVEQNIVDRYSVDRKEIMKKLIKRMKDADS